MLPNNFYFQIGANFLLVSNSLKEGRPGGGWRFGLLYKQSLTVIGARAELGNI